MRTTNKNAKRNKMRTTNKNAKRNKMRPTNKNAEKLIGKYFPVLDKGFVSLVDYMGTDQCIETAARVSYSGGGTRAVSQTNGLLRYLKRHAHTTPYEMVEVKLHCCMPTFIARQWIRHRTACLSGDTELHFDLPGGIQRRGNQLYKISIKKVYDAFNNDNLNKKQRIEKMKLRSLNEDNNEIYHNNIVDIWESGIKEVYKVTLENDKSIKMSIDHRCFTNKGWKTLKEIIEDNDIKMSFIGPGIDTGIDASFNEIDVDFEVWKPVLDWEDYYEVSNQGRVRRIVGGRGSGKVGKPKKLTISQGRSVVSLNKPGKQSASLVHQLVLEAFVSRKPDNMICCHNNGNGLDNRIENLRWDTQDSNHKDRIRDSATTYLKNNFLNIKNIEKCGEEMTYDIEVSGPYHNFSANGFTVHNSVNEMSGRYSLLPMMFYSPEQSRIQTQSQDNKQGSSGQSIDDKLFAEYQQKMNKLRDDSVELYTWLNANDVARELARIDLPLSTYTQWYWKIDLHNLMHFLRLRVDSHAQWEIQEYGKVIAGMVKEIAPLAYNAWLDYDVCGDKMSAGELSVLRDLVKVYDNGVFTNGDRFSDLNGVHGLSKREVKEFLDKLTPKEKPDFTLDISKAKDSSFFEEMMNTSLPEDKNGK